MRTHIANEDRRVAEEKELVEAGHDNGEDEADDPGTQCRRGHRRVVRVRDGRAHLGVRRIVLQRECALVQVRVVELGLGDDAEIMDCAGLSVYKAYAEWRGMNALCPFSTSFSSSDEAE